MTFEIYEIKLSAQVALLGNVTANLRAACIQTESSKITVRFYYDGEISEDDHECAESAMDQIIADFHTDNDGKETTFDYEILQVNYPKKPPLIGSWVYYRFEREIIASEFRESNQDLERNAEIKLWDSTH